MRCAICLLLGRPEPRGASWWRPQSQVTTIIEGWAVCAEHAQRNPAEQLPAAPRPAAPEIQGSPPAAQRRASQRKR
jgi:hypothetical protein